MTTKRNLIINQGSTYSYTISLTNELNDILDLTGYSADSQIRKWYTSSTILATFTTTLSIETGELTLSLTAYQTNNLQSGRYVYDVELTDSNGKISRILEGLVTVSPQVTKEITTPNIKLDELDDVDSSEKTNGSVPIYDSELEKYVVKKVEYITKRVVIYNDGNSITPNISNTDIVVQNNTQNSGTLTINSPIGVPFDGQQLIFRINTLNQQNFLFDTAYSDSEELPFPETSTGEGKWDYIGFIYNADAEYWHLIATASGL